MANSVTLIETHTLTNVDKVFEGIKLHKFNLVYDTGAGELTLKAGVAGKILVLIGLGFGFSSNSLVTIKSNSVVTKSWAVGANFPYNHSAGILGHLAYSSVGNGLTLTCSAAVNGSQSGFTIAELTADQFIRIMTDTVPLRI